jgi:hypothetical protein
VIGGGPVLSLGNPDLFFNIGVLAYYATASHPVGVIVPNLAASVRVSQRVRFGIEAYVPGVFSHDTSDQGFGRIGAIAWGFRLFGDSIWGDVALVEPFCPGCSGIYSAIPLGIPFLNFGSSW